MSTMGKAATKFAALRKKLADKDDVDDPDALAAEIGRKKHGKGAFQKMTARGRAKG